MTLRIRDVQGAYIGKHVEVINCESGKRVFPPDNRRPQHTRMGEPVNLGTDRGSCEAFIAGYRFAREEQR